MIDPRVTQDTAEEFAKSVQQHIINTGEQDTETAMETVYDRRYPQQPRDAINKSLIFNSCAKRQDETNKTIKNRYVDTGTLDLFGHRGFKVPENINQKNWREATLAESYRAMKADQESALADADEHRKAMEKKEAHARFIGAQIDELTELMHQAENAGFDPEHLTYAQAQEKGLNRAA